MKKTLLDSVVFRVIDLRERLEQILNGRTSLFGPDVFCKARGNICRVQ